MGTPARGRGETSDDRAGCGPKRAFVQAVAERHIRGVSTRRVEGLVRTLGIERISKSRVSEMAKELRRRAAEAFRTRPLDGGPHTYVCLDALTQKVREGE